MILVLIYTSKLILEANYLYDICHPLYNIYLFFTVTNVTRIFKKNVNWYGEITGCKNDVFDKNFCSFRAKSGSLKNIILMLKQKKSC